MTVKNYVFRENWVGRDMAGMKIVIFAIFDPTWAQLLAPIGPSMEFLKQNFIFKSLRKTEGILLPIIRLTN